MGRAVALQHQHDHTVQPKNNARARTSFCFLRVACAWILQAVRTSLWLEVKTARTSVW